MRGRRWLNMRSGDNTVHQPGARQTQHLLSSSLSLYICVWPMAYNKGETPLVWDKLKQEYVDPSTLLPRPEKFLKGPIPWPWLRAAAAEDGKCLQVGLCLWRLSGAKRSPTVRLSNLEVEELGVDRYAKSRALKKLEAVGLV